MRNNRKLWVAVFLALVAATLFLVTQSGDSFSVSGFAAYLTGASPVWIVLAVGCVVCFVVLEGLSLLHLSGCLGYRRGMTSGVAYSAADIFFSAITPSATGGQPASAVCMMRDGIPAAVVTVTLLLNLVMYTISILVIGVLCALLRPGIFLHFCTLSRILIVLGAVIQAGLVVVFVMLVFHERLALRAAAGLLRLLARLHLVWRLETKLERLEEIGAEYRACAAAIRENRRMLLPALTLNFLQRVSMIFVSVCVFISMGGERGAWLDVWAAQGFVILGSNSVPIPGAVGVADFLYLDGFGSLVDDLVCMELLSRGISFYCCVLLCGLFAWGWYALRRTRD